MRILLAICALSAFPSATIYNQTYPTPHISDVVYGPEGTEVLFSHDNQVYLKDIESRSLCSYHINNRALFCTYIGTAHLSFAAPLFAKRGHYVVGFNNRISKFQWNSQTNNSGIIVRTLKSVQLQQNEEFNFGICDGHQGLWFGTVKTHGGHDLGSLWSFYPLDKSNQLINQVRLKNIVSKGIVWDTNEYNKLYYMDDVNQKILLFAYNYEEKRVIRFTRVVFDLHEWHDNLPHPIYSGHSLLGRMTIDIRSHLWVPLNGGSHVLDIDPSRFNHVIRFIRLPAAKLNACVFAHDDRFNILYVSSLPHRSNAAGEHDLEGGKIFTVSNLGDDVLGFRAFSFNFPRRPPRGPSRGDEHRYWE